MIVPFALLAVAVGHYADGVRQVLSQYHFHSPTPDSHSFSPLGFGLEASICNPFAPEHSLTHPHAVQDDGLDIDVSTFMIVFGICTVLALVFFFLITAALICVACCKVCEHSLTQPS